MHTPIFKGSFLIVPPCILIYGHSLLQGSFVRGFAPEFDGVAVRRPSVSSFVSQSTFCSGRAAAAQAAKAAVFLLKFGKALANKTPFNAPVNFIAREARSGLQNSHESAPSCLQSASLVPAKSLLVGIPPLLHTGLTLFTSLALFCSCRQILSLSLAVSFPIPLPQCLHGATPKHLFLREQFVP